MQDHQIPRRRVPLLAGERIGLVIGSPSTPMLSADNGAQTEVWLEHATLELQRIQVLLPDECLVEVASDISYARTNTGRLVAL